MVIRWGVLSAKSRKALKTCWLVTAGLVALYIGAIEPQNRHRGMAMQKSAGLAAVSGQVGWEPISLWQQSSVVPRFATALFVDKAVVGGALGAKATYVALQAPQGGGGGGNGEELAADRKLVRTATLDLIVTSPAQSSEKIVALVQATGGFLVTSQTSGGPNAIGATLAIRIPAARFEEVRAQIRKLALRVDGEGIDAQDVTKQYVDQQARLRNLLAQEQQYLGILHKAATVKDTLEVSEKLNEVRGEIEEKQAEFLVLSKQVETVAINITLRAETDAQVFGLHWRPLYQLKIAAREGLDGLGDYAASMTAMVFYLPAILLWLFTILAGAAIGWRVLRWASRLLFSSSKTALSERVVS